MTFAQATVRNNTSNAYHLHVVGLPWGETDEYQVRVERVANGVSGLTYSQKQGKGNVVGE